MSTTGFILDGMLGSLARWLRIAGFDTIYYRDRDDEELLQESLESNRILLSRDRVLIQRSKKKGVRAYFIESEITKEQLTQLKETLGLDLTPEVSRCSFCNGHLVRKTKEEVRGAVPQSTMDAFNEFWVCEECGKIYWKGSHWANITETLE